MDDSTVFLYSDILKLLTPEQKKYMMDFYKKMEEKRKLSNFILPFVFLSPEQKKDFHERISWKRWKRKESSPSLSYP